MKRLIASSLMVLPLLTAWGGETFEKNFNDSTLRVDYIFAGGPEGNRVYVDNMSKTSGWNGRTTRLDEVPLEGNGTIEVKDPATGKTLYKHSFSSLFQEWVNIPEAKVKPRSFENVFLVPVPKKEADITITLRDNRHQTLATATHRYRPGDELVAKRGVSPVKTRYVHKGSDPKDAIDIAMLAEGYKAGEEEAFFAEAKKMAEEILSYKPFDSRKDKFNFIAVMVPSNESGVSVPLEGIWRDTAFGSHYSTFYSARYLTSPNVKRMHDALNGLPYEHVMMLVNTDRYGGGGIYNSYQMATTRHEHSLPVTVHEFGHSFGGLADEYFYDGDDDATYPLDVEPWEPNITTLVGFDSKWKDMLTPGVAVPTPWKDLGGTREERMKHRQKADVKDGKQVVGVYEGGGYKPKGVYRPAVTCRMRDNYHPALCPVCEKSVAELIDFYTVAPKK